MQYDDTAKDAIGRKIWRLLAPRSYDFASLRIDHPSPPAATNLLWRPLAAVFDASLLTGLSLIVWILPGFRILSRDARFDVLWTVVFAYLYGTELLWRQSPGEMIFGLVVIVPPNRRPAVALAIRRVVNLVEFFLPWGVYFGVMAFSGKHCSLSDTCSGCSVDRKSYILRKGTFVATHPPSVALRIVLLLLVTLLSVVLPIVALLCFAEANRIYHIE